MNKFDVLKKIIIKYFIILIGSIVFVLYMWNRFFRERTSKDLPLTLNIIYLIILIYLCMLFSYLIYTLIFPRKSNVIVESLVEFFFTPLKELDIFIKNIPYVKIYYNRFFIYLFEKVEDMITNSNKFFYIFWLTPRLILLTTLYIDIFIFHRFHYKYMVVLFGLFLLLNRYLIYSLKYYKTQIIDVYKHDIDYILTDYVPHVHPSEFEEDYDEKENEYVPTMALPFENFIEFQTKSIVYQKINREILIISSTSSLRDHYWITCIGHSQPNFFNKPIPQDYTNIFGNDVPHNYKKAKSFVQTKIDEHIKHVLEVTLRVSLVIEYYKKTNHDNKKIKLIKIFIYMNYLICWSYVLYISIKSYTISPQDIQIITEIFNKFQDQSNPFSAIID